MKKDLVVFLFFALSFYCFGAGMLDGFAAVPKASCEGMTSVFMLPVLLLILLCVLLYWARPAVVSREMVTTALIFLIVGSISSTLIQIPTQLASDKGNELELLNKLMQTDWIRVIAWTVYMTDVLCMLYKIKREYGRMLLSQ